MNDMKMMTPADQELASTVARSLEAAAMKPDAELDAALAATRARIAQGRGRQARHGSWWVAGGFALAACLALVMVLPFSAGTTPAPANPAVASSASMPDADLQLLENMDMLAALGSES